MLKRLYTAIESKEERICNALKEDLNKGSFESYMCEIGLTLSEISFMIKNLKKFSAEKRVPTPLSLFPSRSYVKPSPYGNVLIMSPWNYPFLLTIEPLADAIAAGNTAVLKPSAYSPATADVIKNITDTCFEPGFVATVTGGRKENSDLLSKKFDFIFFTGSSNVGKEVLRHAAENLIPVVLELGGKSPCIVDNTADIELAAKRIVFGKFLNSGQTCVAPDYILCRKDIKDRLIKRLTEEIEAQFGQEPLKSDDYVKIISERHFERLIALIDPKKTVAGGIYDRQSLKIAPTVMDNVSFSDPVMSEEIFGPLLPVLSFDGIDEIYGMLKDKPKPLALYIFSRSKKNIRQLTERLTFGGGCINDTVIHLSTPNMGFGGVGESGMGQYHGKAGFYAFSHCKSIVKKSSFADIPIRYRPYAKPLYKKLLRIFLK